MVLGWDYKLELIKFSSGFSQVSTTLMSYIVSDSIRGAVVHAIRQKRTIISYIASSRATIESLSRRLF